MAAPHAFQVIFCSCDGGEMYCDVLEIYHEDCNSWYPQTENYNIWTNAP